MARITIQQMQAHIGAVLQKKAPQLDELYREACTVRTDRDKRQNLMEKALRLSGELTAYRAMRDLLKGDSDPMVLASMGIMQGDLLDITTNGTQEG